MQWHFKYIQVIMCIGMEHGSPRNGHRAGASNPRAQVRALGADCNDATHVNGATPGRVWVSQECNSGMAALHREAVYGRRATECVQAIKAFLFQALFKSVVV